MVRLAPSALALGVLAGASGACHRAPHASAAGSAGSAGDAGAPSPVALQLGGDVGCLLADGGLTCWGSNQEGELGNGVTDTLPHYHPEHAGGTQTYVGISVGYGHMCAVADDRSAYCWGTFLTDCVPPCGPSPASFQPQRRFVIVSAGRSQTCGIDESGTAFCWGSNMYGALGTLDDFTITFYQVQGGPYTWIGVAADNVCALTADGDAFCWGLNSFGVLGNGGPPACNQTQTCGTGGANADGIFAPTAVAGNHRFASMCVQAFNACGIDAAGALWCWGSNASGCLGDGNVFDQRVPSRYALPPGVRAESVTCADPICALSTAGDVYCAGDNHHGSLGLGTADGNPHSTATVVPHLPAISVLGTSWGSANCALAFDGSRYCWGPNTNGILGDGTAVDHLSPELVPR